MFIVYIITVCFLHHCVCFRHHCMFTSSLCVSFITECFRHHFVFPSSLCVSVITVCLHHRCVFPSSLNVSVITVCVSVITVCFRHHCVFPSSLYVFFITVCYHHHCVFPTESFSLSLFSLSFSLGFSNGSFRLHQFPEVKYIIAERKKNLVLFLLMVLFGTKALKKSIHVYCQIITFLKKRRFNGILVGPKLI